MGLLSQILELASVKAALTHRSQNPDYPYRYFTLQQLTPKLTYLEYKSAATLSKVYCCLLLFLDDRNNYSTTHDTRLAHPVIT